MFSKSIIIKQGNPSGFPSRTNMKVKMLKMVNADGAFRKVGEAIDVSEDLGKMLVRTGVAEETKEAPKKAKK